jgi:hypothetical protein
VNTVSHDTGPSTTLHGDDPNTAAAARLRAVLERESATRLALKRAKAARFLTLVHGGMKISEVWQLLAADADVRLLEDAYEAAHIDLVIENAINWGKLGISSERDEDALAGGER